MDNVDLNLNMLNVDQPYLDQWDLLSDFMVLLDFRLYYLYKYHMWVGPENGMNKMLGMVVTRQEFENNLMKANSDVAWANLEEQEIVEIEVLDSYFWTRMDLTKQQGVQIPLFRLVEVFKLNRFQTSCLLIGLASEMNKKYEKIFIFLQDNMTKMLPTAEIAIQLFARPKDMIISYMNYFNENSSFSKFLIESQPDKGFLEMPIKLKRRMIDFLLAEASSKDVNRKDSNRLKEGGFAKSFMSKFESNDILHKPYVKEEIIENVFNMMQSKKESYKRMIYLKGEKGNGKKFIVKHAIRRANAKVIFANVEYMLEEDLRERMLEVVSEGILEQAYLCFTGFEYLLEQERKKELILFLELLSENTLFIKDEVFITSTKECRDIELPDGFVGINVYCEMLSEDERLIMWKRFGHNIPFDRKVNIDELAVKFRFTLGQIENSVVQAEELRKIYGLETIDSNLIHNCCYEQVVSSLSVLGNKIDAVYRWDDIVLPESQLEILKQAVMRVKYKHTVYYKWGFDKKVAYGKGLSMLFAGPPGTGKTMAAQVMAHELHMQTYKIQLSQVVSKYIGETEKNLEKIFKEGRNANCILFFDEMDALFGKRSEVKDSNDRHANIEVAYLLQQMEEYDGIIIMATNLLQNIDPAFMRRINYIINFPFPDEQVRLSLWKKLLDVNAPLDEDINLEFMAKQFNVSGGNIKNIVVGAAFMAASEESSINMKHLLKSAVQEQRKNNIIIVKEDLKEYADLIF